MKAILAGLATMIVVSTVAWFGLQNAGFDTDIQMSGPAVRLD